MKELNQDEMQIEVINRCEKITDKNWRSDGAYVVDDDGRLSINVNDYIDDLNFYLETKQLDKHIKELIQEQYEDILPDLLCEKGYNVNSFINKFGFPESTVRSIAKRGINKASIEVVYKIAHALDMTADELYERLRK